MNSRFLRELTLYRYRYYIGYGLFIALLVAILTIDVTAIPRGLSDAEMNSAVASNQINPFSPHSTDIINLPYHLAQKASVSLLGLTPLAIKLPSIFLALGVGICLSFILSHWFSRNVAVLSSLLACTSVPFITMGRTGAPLIMVTVWTIVLLLAATQLTTRATGTFLWKGIALISGILLLYTPFGIYPIIALFVSGILHPHVRHQIKRTKPWQAAVFGLLSLILLAPLVVASIAHPSVLLTVTGFDGFSVTLAALQASIISLGQTFFSFAQMNVGTTIAPFFTFTLTALAILGFFRVLKDHHAARSYMLLFWTSIVVIVLVLDPRQTLLIFTPAILFLAIGVETLIREWYRLFPRNPYARIGALIPLTILVIGTVSVSTSRYFEGYLYTPDIKGFHAELPAVREAFGNDTRTVKRLVVPTEQIAFYDMLRREYPRLALASTVVQDPSIRQVVLATAPQQVNRVPATILTGPLQDDSVLVRVYGPKTLTL